MIKIGNKRVALLLVLAMLATMFFSIGPAVASPSAGLAKVLNEPITILGGLGTTATPDIASIDVANGVATIAAADVAAATGATITFYGTDDTFTTPNTSGVSLTAGGTTVVYVKLTTDSSTLYYAVTINRSAAPSSGSSAGAPIFSNVYDSWWAYNAISSLSSKGIVSGYPDGTFQYYALITRAEFATMLVKALGLNTSGTTGTFTDVTADAWYYGYVNAAASASLVSGMGDNLFAPNDLITREQMSVMVTKALGTKAPSTDGTELNAFFDKSAVSSWAVTGMEEAVKGSIASQMVIDGLGPQCEVTRDQAAWVIYNLLPVLGQ